MVVKQNVILDLNFVAMASQALKISCGGRSQIVCGT